MEWILSISILANLLLVIGCICLARDRNWYRKSWYELANRLVQKKKGRYKNMKLSTRGLVTIIVACCFVGDCLAILVRTLL